jgi:hypothetical protein
MKVESTINGDQMKLSTSHLGARPLNTSLHDELHNKQQCKRQAYSQA